MPVAQGKLGLVESSNDPTGEALRRWPERKNAARWCDAIGDINVWRHQGQVLEARHRAQARVEDRIRHAKDSGLGRFPSRDFAISTAWAGLTCRPPGLDAALETLVGVGAGEPGGDG